MAHDPEQDPDRERVQEHSTDRQHERAASVERMLEDTEGLLQAEKYPTTSEELAVEYADEMLALPNETESLGSVFDRLVDERFESPREAREAVVNELTGEQAGREEYNDERALDELTRTPGEATGADDDLVDEGEGRGPDDS
jgi:hypothetical protein